MSDLLESYLACWNETDAVRRRALLDTHWSVDPSYIDPLAEVHGRDGVDTVIAAVQAQFPGFVFTPHGAVDAHHRQARFSWGLGPVDTEPVVVGFDVVVTDADGRIDSVFGFLDKVPQ